MVFNKNHWTLNQTQTFENEVLQKVKQLPLFESLKCILLDKKLHYKIEILTTNNSKEKYQSYLSLEILDENNNLVLEKDESNCSLMICYPICYSHSMDIIGIELWNDKSFLHEMSKLLEKIG